MTRTAFPLRLWMTTLAGVLLRLGWWWYARPVPVSDFEHYRQFGLELLVHGQLGYPEPSAERVPGYPLFLAAMMLVSRSIDWLSLANIALSVSLIPLVYALTRSLTSRYDVAWLAALACALNPAFILLSPVLASEHLYVLLLLASLMVLLPIGGSPQAVKPRAAIAGILFGCATLTRPDALFYLPVMVAVAGAVTRPFRVRYRPVLIFLLCSAASVAPWYLRNRIVVGPGAGLSVQSGLAFYYAHNVRGPGYHPLEATPLEALSPVDRQRRAYEMGFEYLAKSSATRLVRDTVTATGVLFWSTGGGALHWSTRVPVSSPDDVKEKPIAGIRWLTRIEVVGYRVLLVAAILSIGFIAACPPRTSWVTYGIVVMTWIGYAVIFSASPRYRYLAEVAFCILASVTVSEVARRLRSRR